MPKSDKTKAKSKKRIESDYRSQISRAVAQGRLTYNVDGQPRALPDDRMKEAQANCDLAKSAGRQGKTEFRNVKKTTQKVPPEYREQGRTAAIGLIASAIPEKSERTAYAKNRLEDEVIKSKMDGDTELRIIKRQTGTYEMLHIKDGNTIACDIFSSVLDASRYLEQYSADRELAYPVEYYQPMVAKFFAYSRDQDRSAPVAFPNRLGFAIALYIATKNPKKPFLYTNILKILKNIIIPRQEEELKDLLKKLARFPAINDGSDLKATVVHLRMDYLN